MGIVPRRRLHPLLNAGLAVGIAGAGRIALNSGISFMLGVDALGRYASVVAGVILAGSLASIGPASALTLSVSRRWEQGTATVPRDLVRLFAFLIVVFAVVGGAVQLLALGHKPGTSIGLFAAVTTIYVLYQLARALGYALQRADAVVVAETVGAMASLAALALVVEVRPADTTPWLLLAFGLGPVAFLCRVAFSLKDHLRVVSEALPDEERRRTIKESAVFFVGSGSSMAMQYLPVIIAGRLGAVAVAALLFGAVQATAPLLLLPRVYGAIMMPAFAATSGEGRSRRHIEAVQPFFLPTLAIALGLAPWVVVSIGLAPENEALAVGALIAIMTLMQVWATPAVTALSAQKRELVPAGASVAGLGLAGVIWLLSVYARLPVLLAVGLALGGAARSLIPMWIASGRPLGRLDRRRWTSLAAGGGLALGLGILGSMSRGVTLAGGAAMIGLGLTVGYRQWRNLRLPSNANPAR